MRFGTNESVIVTGGAGFIGSMVVEVLMTERECRVVVVDKLTYAGARSSLEAYDGDPRFRFVQADIIDRDAMTQLVADIAPRAVLHLAAESHVDRSIDGPGAFVETNVVGTFALLQAARAYWDALSDHDRAAFRFVHVSTDEVFGALAPQDPPFCETTPYDPRSPYSATKAASDHLARAWMHTYGLPVVVTNCTNNYGPRQFPEKLIPLMILKAAAGRDLPVYGRGDNVRDWLHVRDHARGLIAAGEQGAAGETYCFGGEAERANLAVVEAICDALDASAPPLANGRSRRSLIGFVSDRPGHDFRYAMDIQHVRRTLGWAPSCTFEDGLRETVRWYLDHDSWWRPLAQKRYAGERLGLSSSAAA